MGRCGDCSPRKETRGEKSRIGVALTPGFFVFFFFFFFTWASGVEFCNSPSGGRTAATQASLSGAAKREAAWGRSAASQPDLSTGIVLIEVAEARRSMSHRPDDKPDVARPRAATPLVSVSPLAAPACRGGRPAGSSRAAMEVSGATRLRRRRRNAAATKNAAKAAAITPVTAATIGHQRKPPPPPPSLPLLLLLAGGTAAVAGCMDGPLLVCTVGWGHCTAALATPAACTWNNNRGERNQMSPVVPTARGVPAHTSESWC